MDEALESLAILIDNWSEIQPTDEARRRAERLLFRYDLATADALQLASALLWCGDDPRMAIFVSQDNRLRLAPRRGGFTVLPTSEQLHEASFERFLATYTRKRPPASPRTASSLTPLHERSYLLRCDDPSNR